MATVPFASENQVKISKRNSLTCISSKGIPNHSVGQFPTKGNPHRFRPQNLQYCFPSKPNNNITFKNIARVVGITVTGIPIRPGTADWHDASSPRKHSRNPSSGWNLEAIRPFETIFGIDDYNAHVDHRGLYHYHKITSELLKVGKTLIGYAADGYEIHYLGKRIKSSWQLKKGIRPTSPFGNYDGSFKQDYEYKRGSGDLDECNGREYNGKYTYFATETFPFFPRCHWGHIGRDFLRP